MKPWLLVSPASRGIGLNLAQKLFRTTTAPMVITARKDVEKLRDQVLESNKGEGEERLEVMQLDFLEERSIADAAQKCKSLFPISSHALHLAYVIPGILHAEKSPAQIDYDKALLSFKTNALGPMLFMKHFSQFLPTKSSSTDGESSQGDIWQGLDPSVARWVFMSARVGSITDNRLGGWFSYRSSKAAVNQITKSFDHYLRTKSGDNAMAISMHPGTVKTDLSKDYWDTVPKEKIFEPDWVADRLVSLCTKKDGVGLGGRGRCWDWDGKEILP